MKILLDTNVVLDHLMNREPFVDEAETVLNAVAYRQIEAAITANTITDIAYLLRKAMNRDAMKTALLGLMELVEVVEVNYERCVAAFDLPMTDYEDALLAHCAEKWGAEYIVTRNIKDFGGSPVKALTPSELLKQCGALFKF